jgi:hypothetical protein
MGCHCIQQPQRTFSRIFREKVESASPLVTHGIAKFSSSIDTGEFFVLFLFVVTDPSSFTIDVLHALAALLLQTTCAVLDVHVLFAPG